MQLNGKGTKKDLCTNCLLVCVLKCIKIFFKYRRGDSMTQILFDIGPPSFNTIVVNSAFGVCKVLR